MIRTLKLNQFGLFRNRTFELGEVTIFYGKNEAGKSTLSDALFYALCRPKKNLKSGKFLSERYGDSISVEIVPEMQGIPEEEYRNLYSIRSNDLSIEINPEAEWGKELRRRLFSGTIDPEGIIRELETMASEKGNVKKMRELTAERKIAEGMEGEISKLQAEWRKILSERTGIERDEAEMKEFESRKRELDESLRTIGGRIVVEEKIRDRSRQMKILTEFAAIASARKQIEGLAQFRDAQPAELTSLEKMRSASDKHIAELTAKIGLHEEGIAKLREGIDELGVSEREAKRVADHAILFLDRVEFARNNLRPRAIRKWRPTGLAVAALALVASAAPLFSGELTPAWRIGIALTGLLASSAIAFLSRGISIESDPEEEGRALSGLAAKWRADVGRELPAASFDLMIQELSRIRASHEEIRRRQTAEAGRVEELSSRLSEDGNRLKEAKSELSRIDGEISRWLYARGIRSKEEYYSGHAELESLKARLKSLLESPVFKNGTPETLRVDAERRLRILDEEHIPSEGISDNDFNRLRADSESIRRELDVLQSRSMEISGRIERHSGDAEGRLSLLAPELVRLEERLHVSRERIRAIELDRSAAQMAGRIFENILQNMDENYREIESRIETFFGALLPQRRISSEKMDIKNYRVTDAGGNLRGADHLSAGTRDLFIFSAKLALAAKMQKEPRILVLDDPFLTLDEERERRSLEMLEWFRSEHGEWQIILFTKESRLRDEAGRVFKNAVVYDIAAAPV